MKTKQLAIDAMLIAMCAVLGYVAIDLQVIKVTFESLPILIAALMFGPVDGMIVGGVGTLIYQLLRYGVSPTTLLWMAPYIICGFIVGYVAKKNDFRLSNKQIMILVIVNELLITILNTGVIYLDSKIFYYYFPGIITGSLVPRLIVCVVKAAAFGALLPVLRKSVQRAVNN